MKNNELKSAWSELSANQQVDYKSKYEKDPAYDHRLTLNGVPIIQDEYFDEAPIHYSPPPPDEFSPRFLEEIEKTKQLLMQIKARSENGQ